MQGAPSFASDPGAATSAATAEAAARASTEGAAARASTAGAAKSASTARAAASASTARPAFSPSTAGETTSSSAEMGSADTFVAGGIEGSTELSTGSVDYNERYDAICNASQDFGDVCSRPPVPAWRRYYRWAEQGEWLAAVVGSTEDWATPASPVTTVSGQATVTTGGMSVSAIAVRES